MEGGKKVDISGCWWMVGFASIAHLSGDDLIDLTLFRHLFATVPVHPIIVVIISHTGHSDGTRGFAEY